MNPTEQIEAMRQELQAAAHQRLAALAWRFAKGDTPNPDEVSATLAAAAAGWDDFLATVRAAEQTLVAARDLAEAEKAERELATVEGKLREAIRERDKAAERHESKVAQLNDLATMLRATITAAKQKWAAAREKAPGAAGDTFREAQRQLAALQGELAQRESLLREVNDAVQARRMYRQSIDELDEKRANQAAAEQERLEAKAAELATDIERLRCELADAERQAAEAEQTLLKLAQAAV